MKAAAGCLLAFSIAAVASAQVASGRAEVPAPVLYYEMAGQGPPVVLIHGGQMDRRMWDPQFALFAKSFRVTRYDVRGYGRSETPALVYSDVEDLYSLLRFLKVPRAHLIGLSLGGRIAIDFTLEHPEMVGSVVAVGPGLSGFPWSGNERWMTAVRVAQKGGGEAAAELWLKDPYMAPAMEHRDLAPRLRQLALENARVWLQNPLLEMGIDPPAFQRLAQVQPPMLVVVGDRDVPDIQKIVDLLAKEVRGAKKVVIQGAGHIVNMEAPEQFDRVVLEFLKAQPSPR